MLQPFSFCTLHLDDVDRSLMAEPLPRLLQVPTEFVGNNASKYFD